MGYLPRRFAAGLMAAGLLFTAACTKLPEDYPTPTPLPTPAESNKPVYTVTRGTIEQQVKALGRVAAQQESVMYFRQAGRLYHMYVETNQKVKKGDLLAELDTGTLKDQVKVAQAQADIAELKVDQAMGKDSSGSGESAAVSSAQASLAKAEADAAQAQDSLDKLLEGPTTADLQSAQAAVASAQTKLQTDQTALKQLQEPPTQDQLTILRTDLEEAQATLQQAQAAYDKVKYNANIGAMPQSAALQKATADYNAAKAKYDEATAPPKPEDVANAKKQVEVDQASVKAAQSQLAELKQGPTSADVDAAKQAVASAQAGVDLARTNLQQAQGAAAGKSIDVQIAQKQADLAKLQLQTLQSQLDDAQLRAPFDGVITEVDAQDGDSIQSYTPVLTVSNPTKLEIAVELQPADLTQVAVGQLAKIVLSSYPKSTLQGKVVRLPETQQSNAPQLPATLRTVRINLPTPPGPVHLGDLANVTIDVKREDNVLLLPTAAIQTFGGRRFVQLAGQSGGPNQEVDITVGISDDTNTEIVKGLKAGQKVVAP